MPAKRKPEPRPERTPVCHFYGRISDPDQDKGGGLVRQTPADEARREFCSVFKFDLSRHMLIDDGVSAFEGLNATPDHELGRFLADAKEGLIPPGDCLLLENWDRLSRQNIWASIGLVNDLRQLGIHVGRLDRMKLLRCDSTDPGDFFEAAVELMRGHSESDAKRKRNGSMWQRKREAAREKKAQPATTRMGSDAQVLTRQMPAWLRLEGTTPVPIPERAAALARVFDLAAAGYGLTLIAKTLTAEGVKPFGDKVVRVRPGDVVGEDGVIRDRRGRERRRPYAFAGRWTVPYLANILKDRRVLGEYQPKAKGREPDGDPIPGYFPAVISDAQFWAAQQVREQRPQTRPARRGKHNDVFAGLLTDARSGSAYMAATKSTNRTLITHASTEGRGPCYSFPVDVFETAALSLLREIDPHDILNGDHPPDEATALAAEHAEAAAAVKAATADLDRKYSSELAGVLGRLVDRRDDLARRLGLARQKAAHPASESWGEMKTLAAILATAADPVDARLRLRRALRRIIDDVRLLVVARGRDRLCAAQVFFADRPVTRTYLIMHRAAGRNREARWRAWSLADVLGPNALDLRNAEDVADVIRALESLDLTLDAG